MKQTLLVTSLLLLSLGTWACGEDNNDGCGSDVDCPTTQICSAGTCTDASANNGANNGDTNNGAVNNGANNGDNNGDNNGTNNGDTNNGAVNNGAVNNGGDNNGDNNGDFNNNPMVDCQTPGPLSGATVTGRIYRDSNGSDQSAYASAYEEGVDRPLGGLTVQLIAEDGTELETSTCADGQYGFDQLEEGVYVLQAEVPGRCAQRNCPKRFPQAIREGQIKIVTFGDSVPVQGQAPFFPTRLTQLLSPLAQVDNQNIAVGGTTSVGWLPNTANFQNRLLPQVDDADVIMISLGGNDILAFVQSNLGNLNDIPGLVQQAFVAVEIIIENLLEIIDAIRERNTTADIVYLLYPNYGLAVNNQIWSLVNTLVGAETVRDILISARDGLPEDADVLLVDLFGASEAEDLPLDDYLFDPLHFNDLGQTLYAEEIFKAMGGVLIGPNPLTGLPRTPLGVEANFSAAP